ncbi:MAG: hypothetical protein ACOYVK_17670 [Bacillota bacterium]
MPPRVFNGASSKPGLRIILQICNFSGVMGMVRAFPKRSEGPTGKRWNCPRGAAGAMNRFLLIAICYKLLADNNMEEKNGC